MWPLYFKSWHFMNVFVTFKKGCALLLLISSTSFVACVRQRVFYFVFLFCCCKWSWNTFISQRFACCLLYVCVRCVINFIQKKRKGKWESEREIIVVLPSHFICVNVKVVVLLLWVAGFDLLALVEVSVLYEDYTLWIFIIVLYTGVKV